MQTTENQTPETYAFSADINQLLSLIINTFYTNKDVFLRELISNASDALDKIRYQSITNPSLLGDEPNFEIKISFDKDNKHLIIQDTGIGMTKTDLVNNLGTIAKSGTKAFLESLTAGADISMIGQFGVGFYSAYLVAEKVTVISKSNDDKQHRWESMAGGSFTVSEDSSMDIKRGTALILHLKDDMVKYLEENEVKGLIKTHNQFIDFPIYVQVSKTRDVEVVKEEEQKSDSVEVSEEKTDDVNETIKETYYEFEHVNQNKPIWTRNSKDVTTEEYNSFYKSICGDYEDPLDVSHFSVEGQIEFKGLLFIPKRAPNDMFDSTTKKLTNIKLYVRKVFISDNSDDLIPEYLRFIKGVIDSEDLPLNISRETLQQNKIMKVLKKNIVKKSLDLINGLTNDEEKYNKFYEQFSKNIKLGIHEDTTNREKLASFLRYESSKSDGLLTSFEDYIGRMNETQKSIYYITGESKKAIINSPFLEKLKKKDIEVLYMVDPIDEYVIQQLKDYNTKELVCITKENLNLGEEDSTEKESFESLKKDYEPVCAHIKSILGDEIEKVVVSNRLDNYPCVIVTGTFGWTANMQRIMKAQALRANDGMSSMMNKRTLEINPYNNIIKSIKAKLDDSDNTNSRTLSDLIHLLYDVTLQSSGFTLDDPSTFSNRILNLINIGLGIDETDTNEDDTDITETTVLSPDNQVDSTMEEVD
jgi:molecular chaperone HtpG